MLVHDLYSSRIILTKIVTYILFLKLCGIRIRSKPTGMLWSKTTVVACKKEKRYGTDMDHLRDV